ncbi:MAG: biopolymer transporter ExbD [Flavobacteriales bacterium]|nr:biopolymer transporter ExbD [Flavobacteriales bacterium]NNK80165.1 biopolymer transporter ExbD [Flavobacteriales bacterium]
MSKFTGKKKKGVGAVSTASLPDIVFMLLFFFMVTTVMREQDLLVKITKPDASEITKLEKKSLVDYINIGPPQDDRLGSEPVIQLDDAIITDMADIQPWIEDNREQRSEGEQSQITTSLKVDKKTKMGIVTDVKQELRKAQALKINYSANTRERTGSN